MKFSEFIQRFEEIRRVEAKISHGEVLTPQEQTLAEKEWPASKRCGCCGRILGPRFDGESGSIRGLLS